LIISRTEPGPGSYDLLPKVSKGAGKYTESKFKNIKSTVISTAYGFKSIKT
jgi:hypothetical protein